MLEQFEAKDIRTRGAVILLRTGGSGPHLLLLHGYPQTLVMWHKIMPELARKHTVVAADLRGYGDSSRPPDGDRQAVYSFREMARDQIEVMAALGFEQFLLVGADVTGRSLSCGH